MLKRSFHPIIKKKNKPLTKGIAMQMSELISIWYKEFCIKKRKPVPSFETFKSLMAKLEYDLECVIKYYDENFAETPKEERKNHD